jgi:hypothetical protein
MRRHTAAVVAAACPPFRITHAPGHMLVTDLRNSDLMIQRRARAESGRDHALCERRPISRPTCGGTLQRA